MGARRLQEEHRDAGRTDEPWDQLDVPAAVVCALCGDPGCPGCGFESTSSGIVAIVPWERPGTASLLARLWTTARATTKEPDAFFGGLPDGPVSPAFAFAALAELFATLSWTLLALGLLVAVVPAWCRQIALDPHDRALALRVIVATVPSFAAMLVAAHVAHGLSLDHGARKVGAPPATRRALRFGLYATGWDLVIGPVGAVILALKEGAIASTEVAKLGAGIPTASARAFLRAAYSLDAARSKTAIRSSYVAAIIATLVAAVTVVSILGAVLFLFPPAFFR